MIILIHSLPSNWFINFVLQEKVWTADALRHAFVVCFVQVPFQWTCLNDGYSRFNVLLCYSHYDNVCLSN